MPHALFIKLKGCFINRLSHKTGAKFAPVFVFMAFFSARYAVKQTLLTWLSTHAQPAAKCHGLGK